LQPLRHANHHQLNAKQRCTLGGRHTYGRRRMGIPLSLFFPLSLTCGSDYPERRVGFPQLSTCITRNITDCRWPRRCPHALPSWALYCVSSDTPGQYLIGLVCSTVPPHASARGEQLIGEWLFFLGISGEGVYEHTRVVRSALMSAFAQT
jgi:hypothetical protein